MTKCLSFVFAVPNEVFGGVKAIREFIRLGLGDNGCYGCCLLLDARAAIPSAEILAELYPSRA
jgi:hypothetical protein